MKMQISYENFLNTNLNNAWKNKIKLMHNNNKNKLSELKTEFHNRKAKCKKLIF